MEQRFNVRFVLGISLVSALGGFLFGYDWVVVGGAKFFYERYFLITDIPRLQGLAMSSALIGCIPGAMLAGYFSERFGRKSSLVLAAILFTLSAAGTGLVSGFAPFMLFRIAGGIGIGIAATVSPMYIAEVSPRNMRGKLVSLNQLTVVIGILLAQVTNYLIAREVPENATNEFIHSSWNGQMAWRWMFWAETAPALFFFVLALFIPESPRWLVKREKERQAGIILEKIGGVAYAGTITGEIRESLQELSERIDFRALLNKKIRPIILLGLVIAFLQQWCGINIVFNYAEEVFTSAGFGISDSFVNIIITGVVNLLFTFVAIRTVDNWGRRKLMLFGYAGLAMTYLFLGASYMMGLEGHVVLGIIVVAISIYAMSLAPITWVVLSEIFPNRVRSAAMATATTTLWIASALLVLLFPVIRAWINISGAFWLYAVICIAGYFYIRKKLPETKGRSLEEIEGLFKLKKH